MRIAYGKICRSIPLTLDEASNVGGDAEVVNLLNELLNADHEVHLISRNQGKEPVSHGGQLVNHFAPGGLFTTNAPKWAREKGPESDAYMQFFMTRSTSLPEFDAIFMWLGDHGTSNHPMPGVAKATKGKYTTCRQQDAIYGFPPLAILNALGDQRGQRPHWLCPDPRNVIKFRDLWHADQRPVMAQYNWRRGETSFYHEVDDKIRVAGVDYRYSGIELLAVPRGAWHVDYSLPRLPFGLLINEGYNNLPEHRGRKDLVRAWCDPERTEIFGTWSDSSRELLRQSGFLVGPPVDLNAVNLTLQRWRATMTFPATNTGWATSKPWECFRAGTVCFRHPNYDTQDHIYSRKHGMSEDLYTFLSPRTLTGFKDRLKELDNIGTWRQIADAQLEYFVSSWDRLEGGSIAIKDALVGQGGW